MRRNRLYRNGMVIREDFDADRIREFLGDPENVVWLDLESPDDADLAMLAEEFELSPLAIEDIVHMGQRPKVRHQEGHLVLSLYWVMVDPVTTTLTTSELAVVAGDRWLITVRKTGAFDMDQVKDTWDASPDLAKNGVAFLLHGLLDHVVDGHFDAVRQLDEAIESVESSLFTDEHHSTQVQLRSYAMRKTLVDVRRVALPMREVLNTFTRRDLHVIDAEMQPYFADVYDHVLRVTEWTESLRDLVGTIQDANLQMQSNRINEVMRRLSAYAAIFAASTSITGFYGMNVLFPQIQTTGGAVTAGVLLVLTMLGLVAYFRHKRWL